MISQIMTDYCKVNQEIEPTLFHFIQSPVEMEIVEIREENEIWIRYNKFFPEQLGGKFLMSEW